MWGKYPRENNAICLLSASFLSLHPLPTSKLGPPGVDSQVGGFVYFLEPCGSLQQTFLWAWEFLPWQQPPQIFSQRFWGFISLCWTLGCVVCLTPQLLLLVYLHENVGPPSLPATPLLWVLSTMASHLHPSYLSGWMFLLKLLGCWTSIQLVFLAVLCFFCLFVLFFFFKFVVVLLLVVRGGTVHLPMPPSWLEV